MLILTRRTGEEIDITAPDGTRISLVVLGVIGNQVRYGIVAPKSWIIDRREITLRKQRERAARDQNGDVDGNRFEPGPLDEPPAPPDPEPPKSASTLRLAKPYRPRVDNPDDLNHRRKLEGIR